MRRIHTGGGGSITIVNAINKTSDTIPSTHTLSYKLKGFQDWKRVRMFTGKGGDGSISFEKSAKVIFGPPNGMHFQSHNSLGGNGGNGGDIYVRADKSITCLNSMKSLYRAPNGECGRSRGLHGAAGESVEIVVPVGTIVRQVFHNESDATEIDGWTPPKNIKKLHPEEAESFLLKHFKFRAKYTPQLDRVNWLLSRIPLAKPIVDPIYLDLLEDGERHLILKGGRSGKGNPHFIGQDIRGPPFALRGECGTEAVMEFELKSLADAGLVGLPNAGKSSFLSAVSHALPKIAPYPFTTMNPYIGTIDYPDYYSMTLADIPGIIKGASHNAGLGHTFLRHIERSKILVYVVDLSGAAPWEDLDTLKYELEAYRTGLTSKPSLIIANKADAGQKARLNLKLLTAKCADAIIVPVSARESINIELATQLMRQLKEKTTQLDL